MYAPRRLAPGGDEAADRAAVLARGAAFARGGSGEAEGASGSRRRATLPRRGRTAAADGRRGRFGGCPVGGGDGAGPAHSASLNCNKARCSV